MQSRLEKAQATLSYITIREVFVPGQRPRAHCALDAQSWVGPLYMAQGPANETHHKDNTGC